MRRDKSARVCIIGAGPSGITAAKNLLQVGLENIVVYEKGDQVGGNWVYSPRLSHSSVFETTHIISSKTMSQYLDYPMPQEYPDYPSHKQLLDYFQGYIRRFGLEPYIRFNTEVTKAEKNSDETWHVTLGDGAVETFDHLLVCNGHHWDPRLPEYPGSFTGEFIHSHDYKQAESFRDKRVLVIGGGNSACDIAVETSRVSAFTAVSMRRGYYIIPKFLMGLPTDVLAAKNEFLPKWIRMPMFGLLLRLAVGIPQMYDLQKPDHKLLQAHPTANSELLDFIRHGKVHPRRDIQRFEGKCVHFVDGKAEEYDAIIAATGFKITFPFFDKSFIDFSGRDVPLYLRVFHPDHPSLYFIGLVQPQGALWPLSDIQAKLVANYIAGNCDLPADIRQRVEQETQRSRKLFLASPRHSVEVEYSPYHKSIEQHIPDSAPAWKDRQSEMANG
jgi:cation diffusion facilitator CzcD-associated flavoprotein CzcO